MTCTFFGHRDFKNENIDKLRCVVRDLIENQGVNNFYVGHQGNFDWCALVVLREMKEMFLHIDYKVVLSHIGDKYYTRRYSPEETMVYDGFEHTPPKFSIDRRNMWMLKKSEWVVGYIVHPHTTGGAAQYAEVAKKQKKHYINIAKTI